jgi:uncharacterized protein with GYD domain
MPEPKSGPKYFVFMSLTRDGVASLGKKKQKEGGQEDLETVIKKAIDRAVATSNVAIVRPMTYALFGGPYDLVTEFEAREFEDAAYLAVKLTETGVVQTTTQKAYTLEEFSLTKMRGKMAP